MSKQSKTFCGIFAKLLSASLLFFFANPTFADQKLSSTPGNASAPVNITRGSSTVHSAKSSNKPFQSSVSTKSSNPAQFGSTVQATKTLNKAVTDKWALVVGISKFEHKELNLRYSDQDARDFADFLVNNANFARDHVKLLINEQATQKAINSELGNKWLPRVADKDDLVVVFISSHGRPAEFDIEGVNYVLAYDSDPDDLYATGIDMEKLAAIIKARVHCDRIVIVLDACHSGAARASTKGLAREANIDAAKIALGSGLLVIASSLPNQASWEFREQANSVFTRGLIQGFQSKGKDTKLADAFAYLKSNVESTVLRERGRLQTPVLRSAWEGNDLVISALPTHPRPVPIEASTQALSGSATTSPERELATKQAPPSESDSMQSKENTQLVPGDPKSKETASDDISSDIQPDAVDLKRIFPEEKKTERPQQLQTSIKVPPLPDRVALLAFSGTPGMESNLIDYMNNPIILLQQMVSAKLQSSLGRRFVNVFDSSDALARTELAAGSMTDKENVMNIGRSMKSRYIVHVSIEQASFDKKGNCYFATILRIFDGQTGELAIVQGFKSDCPPFQGKQNERPTYIKAVVLPQSAEQITQEILNTVNFQQ